MFGDSAQRVYSKAAHHKRDCTVLQILTTRLCLFAATVLICACGNKGDLYLELDDQIEKINTQTSEEGSHATELQRGEADTVDSDDDDDKKNRDSKETTSDS